MRAVCAGRNSTYKWYARGMREAFARLVHTSREILPVGFGGCRLDLYAGTPRAPQGTLKGPFKTPFASPLGALIPPHPLPHPHPRGGFGMRTVCAWYARGMRGWS